MISELGRCCRGFTLFGCCVPRVAAMVRGLRFSTFDPGSQSLKARNDLPALRKVSQDVAKAAAVGAVLAAPEAAHARLPEDFRLRLQCL